jgi:GxxExxY protein
MSRLIHRNVTEAIIGAFFEVYNYFGFGFLEATYASAMEMELRRRNVVVEREVPVTVYYKGRAAAHYRFDLLVEGRVVVEIKAGQQLARNDLRQLTNYLRCTELEVGLLLHFGPEAKFYRTIASNRTVVIPEAIRAESGR